MKTKLLFVFVFLVFQGSFAKTFLDPITPAVILQYCDSNNDGFGVFDLESLTPIIVSAQSGSASDYTVTYHETPDNAQDGVFQLASPYDNIDPWSQIVYYRITQVSTNTHATGLAKLNVNVVPEATTPSDYHLCDVTGAVGFETFNLATVIPEVLGTINPSTVTVTFHMSQADANVGTSALPYTYTNTASPTTLYIRITNISTGCYDTVPLNLIVDPLPQSTQPNYPEYALCDDNAPIGYETFDLGSRINMIAMGQVGVDVAFYPSLGDAQVGTNQITNLLYVNTVQYVQTLGIRLTNPATGCFVISTMNIRVAQPPTAPVFLSSIAVCDSDGNPSSGSTLINLTQRTADILAQQPLPASNYTVTYHSTQSDAEGGFNPIIPATNYFGFNGETIWCRVQLPSTACYAVGSFGLIVNSQPLATGPQSFSACDYYDNPYDGIGTVNLTQFNSFILNGQNPTTHQIKYYATQADAVFGTNHFTLSMTQSYITEPFQDTVYVRVENNATGCYALTTININITPSPNPIVNTANGVNSICVDYINGAVTRSLTLNSGISNPSAYTFEWFEASSPFIVIGTGPTYTVDTPSSNGATRSYLVRAYSNGSLGCGGASIPFDVIQSGPAAVTTAPGYTIANLSGVQSITVAISGYGAYEYSLDNGAHQSSNVFNNVALGSHQIQVWDLEGGCSELLISNVEITESQVPAPIGLNSQSFAPGATLANIAVNGTNVQWYATATNKNNLSMLSVPLPLSTVLVDGVTYYATQTVGGIESVSRLAVTVHIALGIDDNEILPIQFGPNPVKHSLTLQSAVILKSIIVYTMLGQKVFEQEYNDTEVTIDLSKLATGNYVLQAQGETGPKSIRIIKE